MSKIVIRYFLDALDGQEKWLNRMAKRGYRLVKTGKLTYTFESCEPSEYEYRVELAGGRGMRDLHGYRDFLDGMGYRTFYKNLNLNWSYGKIVWNPWRGAVSTVPGSYNKELLIVEKKRNGTPLKLHTSREDRIEYFQRIRNLYICGSIFLFLIAVFGRSQSSDARLLAILEAASPWIRGAAAALGVYFLFLCIRSCLRIRRIREE